MTPSVHKLLRSLLHSLAFTLGCVAIGFFWQMNTRIEMSAKLMIAEQKAVQAGHEAERTRQLVFLMTKTELPPEKMGCPLDEVQGPQLDKNGKPLKDKRGKVKTKVVC